MLSLVISSTIVFVLLLVQLFFSKKSTQSSSQLSSLESGFENLKFASVFSSSFFLLAVLFVLFDMETFFFLPCVLQLVSSSTLKKALILSFVNLFVSGTLVMEWALYGLKWQM